MQQPALRRRTGDFFLQNNVTILFVVLCVVCFFASGTSLSFLLPELFTRIGRNTFMVLSLIIPVLAGLGLNFGIVVGAMAAQISIFLVVHWGFTGITGILLCAAISTVLGIIFGYLIGRLFNSMKGTEMIGGLVAGYFSDGLYQLLFLVIFGAVIPINNPVLMISTGVGVKNTINLDGNLKYALDNMPVLTVFRAVFIGAVIISAVMLLFRKVKKQDLGIAKILKVLVPLAILFFLTFIPFFSTFLGLANDPSRLQLRYVVEYGSLVFIVFQLWRIIEIKAIQKKSGVPTKNIIYIVVAGIVYGLTWIGPVFSALVAVRLPVLTYLLIAGLCVFTPWFMSTKLGQNMRTVGHDREVATSAGINVNRTRIIAMIMSTVLASYAQLITLQNIGTVATYGAHNQVGLYAIAALLVGGASVHKATTGQAVLGVVLFHTLFILAPMAGQAIFGNSQIGEYFRVFVAYGVIALSLAMHAWKGKKGFKGDDVIKLVATVPPAE